MRKQTTQAEKNPASQAVTDFNLNCKKHLDSKQKDIWLCYDCKKFTCTRCYAKEHKHCWADLIENMYDEMKTTNESNLEAVRGMRSEFEEEVMEDLIQELVCHHHLLMKLLKSVFLQKKRMQLIYSNLTTIKTVLC